MRMISNARRWALLAAGAVAMSVAAPSLATADCCNSNRDRGFQESEMRVRVLTDQGAFSPDRLILATPNGQFVAELPRRADVIDQNRINLSGAPLAGALFGPRPLVSYLRDERVIGRLYRRGGDLIAVFDPRLGADASERFARGPIALATRPPFKSTTVVLFVAADARPVSGRAAPHGAPIGYLYDADDGLLLGPPWRRFYGHQLF